MHRLTLAHLTAIGLATPDIVTLAADIGCQGVALNPGTINIDLGGPISRLDKDPAVRRATAQALATTGVQLDLVDAIGIGPAFSLTENAATLKVFRDLGATRLNIVVMDTDMSRVRQNLAAVCRLAKEIGMLPMLEFSGLGGPISSLKFAAGLAASGEYAGLTLMIDSLHLARCGETPADVAALDPALIGSAQICDGPLAHPGKDAYRYEALFERGIPGEGELPLLDFLNSIPADVLVSPEVPLKALRASGVPIHECARRAVEGAGGLGGSLHSARRALS
jgi:sugar phosphate isomerase/epimerase